MSSGRSSPSESDSAFSLMALCLLSEPIPEASRQNEHNQRPLKREIRDLIQTCVSRQDLVLMLAVKNNVIVHRPECSLTKLALENSGALECGKGGETAWSTYRRTTAPLLSDTRCTSLCQNTLTELHAASPLRANGYDLFRSCYMLYEGSQESGLCHRLFAGRRHPLRIGCSLGSADPVGHLCCQGGLSFWWPEIEIRNQNHWKHEHYLDNSQVKNLIFLLT